MVIFCPSKFRTTIANLYVLSGAIRVSLTSFRIALVIELQRIDWTLNNY